MTESEKAERVYSVFQSIARSYDAGNDRISLRLHRRWKRAAIAALAREKPSGPALDLGCGTGDMLELLSGCFPEMELVGLDISPNMLDVAHERLGGRAHISLRLGDALRLPYEKGSFGCVVCAFALRNAADCGKVAAELARVLKPGGAVCILDSFVPERKSVLPLYRLYFGHVMPLLGGGFRKRREYDWLNRSTELFASAKGVAEMLRSSGIEVTAQRSFMFGACVCIVGRKKMS